MRPSGRVWPYIERTPALYWVRTEVEVVLVVDADDPTRPAERLDVVLVGFPGEP